MCPIETPEDQTSVLINSFQVYAKIKNLVLLKHLNRRVDRETAKVQIR